MKRHEPIQVRYVRDGYSSCPEPPFDPGWSALDRLRWHAGCVEAQVGIRVDIVTGCASVAGVPVPGLYGYSYSRGGGGSMPYGHMWAWLNGLEVGARIGTRSADQ